MFDEEERLRKFNNPYEIIEYYMDVRRKFYIKRKEYQIKNLVKEVCVLSNKARFISELLDNTLDLRRKKREVINQLLKDRQYDIIDNDNDFKYLVRLPMDSVSEENVEKIKMEALTKQNTLSVLKSRSIDDIWIEELDILREQYLIYIKKRRNENINVKKNKKKFKIVTKKG